MLSLHLQPLTRAETDELARELLSDDEPSDATLTELAEPYDVSLQAVSKHLRVLEDAGYRVSRKDPVELDRAGYLDALAKGTINLVPDWTNDLVGYVYSQPGAPAASTTVPPSVLITPSLPTVTFGAMM